MAKFWQQTTGEKHSTIASLGLFFGALLGANLGTLSDLPLRDYILIIVLLAGAVSMIQITVASERRAYVAATSVLYVAVLGAIYFVPDLRPAMSESDLLKLLATLGVWLAATVAIEITPTVEDSAHREVPES